MQLKTDCSMRSSRVSFLVIIFHFQVIFNYDKRQLNFVHNKTYGINILDELKLQITSTYFKI